MTRTLAALIAALLVLPAAMPQDDPKDDKEKAKAEAKKRDEAAQATLKEYREAKAKARSADDTIEAVQKLGEAEPHPLLRNEILNVLQTDRSIDVRLAAAGSLGKYKRDVAACEALLRNARAQKDQLLKLKCMQKFGAIAPFYKSLDLKSFFDDEDIAMTKEAISAIEAINSVRMLRPLVDLLSELEQIREDKDGSQGGGQGVPPPPGVPAGSSNSTEQKQKRKKELTAPTRMAINTLWKKYDSKTKLNDSTQANAALARNRSFIQKIQDQEDREDKGLPPEAPGKDKK